MEKNNSLNIPVTYVVFTFNQEQYIKNALESALNQSYSPIEILISDDCSSDRTFEIITDLCGSYTGPNKIIVQRNKENLGLVRHINKVMTQISNDLVIIASGDDIARADKVGKIQEINKTTDALVIGCNPEIINQSGDRIGQFYSGSIPEDFSWKGIIKRRNAGVFISAFDKKIFDQWGALDENLPIEDQSIPFRASLMKDNAIFIIDEPLVKYRSHCASIVSSLNFARSNKNSTEIFLRKLNSHVSVHQSWFNDLESSHISIEQKNQSLKLLKQRIERYNYLIDVMNDTVFQERLSIWKKYFLSGGSYNLKKIIYIFPAVFPSIFVVLVSSLARVKWRMKKQPLGY